MLAEQCVCVRTFESVHVCSDRRGSMLDRREEG